VAYAMQNLIASSEVKIYGIAAANQIIKMRKLDKESSDKQLLQEFVNNIFQFVTNIDSSIA
jgi:hypothetical protein